MMKSQIGETLKLVGLANLLWNKTEVLWYLYFTVLMKETNRALVDSIYRSHDTGNKKRALILSVASEVLKANPLDLERVRAIVLRTNEAARTRNALIHADFHLEMDGDGDGLGISPGGDHSKQNRLAGRELIGELSKFITLLKQLVADIEGLLSEDSPLPGGAVALTSVRWIELLEEALARRRT